MIASPRRRCHQVDSLELCQEAGRRPPAAVAWAPGPLAWGPGIPEIFPSCRAAPLCLALISSSGQHQRQPCSLLWVFFFFSLGWICNLIVTMETQEFWYMKVGASLPFWKVFSNCCKEHVWQLLACGETLPAMVQV